MCSSDLWRFISEGRRNAGRGSRAKDSRDQPQGAKLAGTILPHQATPRELDRRLAAARTGHVHRGGRAEPKSRRRLYSDALPRQARPDRIAVRSACDLRLHWLPADNVPRGAIRQKRVSAIGVRIIGETVALGIEQDLHRFAPTLPLPTELGGVKVLLGGRNLPLYSSGPEAVNAQVPFEVAPGSDLPLIILARGNASSPQMVRIGKTSPG